MLCMHVFYWEECHSEAQLSVTSKSVCSTMDVKLNVLKYPSAGTVGRVISHVFDCPEKYRSYNSLTPAGRLAPRGIRSQSHTQCQEEKTLVTHTGLPK